ncbi:hypothetical protein EST38_g11070 [Candolleomyces aberdarensis]|uniref:Uncharacterized protein n=1 Tax=Candolleomyces aberdarensis TaxID=2316362 RepID=A0A4Q2D7D0_9AGAR|nr:hypothetical protein EST38_g11070 [Candolleomyces aberdarensis]
MDQSPFCSVIGTNYVPTEEECQMITEFLAAPEKQLIEMQAKISQQEAVPQQLKEQYEDLQGNIEAHRALVSIFRRLPDDILREIFLLCLPLSRDPAMCAAEPPLLLTHVCGRWRQVACSTPRLWTSLYISDYLYEGQVQESKLESRDEGILQWIGRAGCMSLSLSFPTPQVSSGPEERSWRNTDLRRLLCMLSPSFHRWRKANILLEGLDDELFDIVSLQNKEGQKPFQSVEQLSIRVSLSNGTPVTMEEHIRKSSRLLSELGLDSSKRLRRLGLYLDEGIPLHSESLQLSNIFPCGQLEVLDLQGDLLLDNGAGIPLNFLPSLLQACPQLVVFRANVSRPSYAPFPPVSTSRIPLNRLKEMSLFFRQLIHVDTFGIIARCDWPTLTSLYLRVLHSDYADMPLLSACTDKFSTPLTSLRLSSFGIRTFALIDLMFALPTLIQLHLDHPALSDIYREQRFDCDDDEFKLNLYGGLFCNNFIAHLTPKPNGTPYALPQLRFLKWERNTGFSDKALAHLLQQRSSSVPMKQVHIYFGRAMQEDILPVCSNLVEAGLDLRLKYPPAFDTSRESTYQNKDYVQPLEVDHYRTFGWD